MRPRAAGSSSPASWCKTSAHQRGPCRAAHGRRSRTFRRQVDRQGDKQAAVHGAHHRVQGRRAGAVPVRLLRLRGQASNVLAHAFMRSGDSMAEERGSPAPMRGAVTKPAAAAPSAAPAKSKPATAGMSVDEREVRCRGASRREAAAQANAPRARRRISWTCCTIRRTGTTTGRSLLIASARTSSTVRRTWRCGSRIPTGTCAALLLRAGNKPRAAG